MKNVRLADLLATVFAAAVGISAQSTAITIVTAVFMARNLTMNGRESKGAGGRKMNAEQTAHGGGGSAAFTAGVATLSCLLFGLLPAFRATKAAPVAAMRAAGRGLTAGRERFALRRVLVSGQVALSLVRKTARGCDHRRSLGGNVDD